MILPIKMVEDFIVPMPRLADDLYLILNPPGTRAQIGFYIRGWLWGLQVFSDGTFICYTKGYYNRVTTEALLDFVSRNTTECVDTLLFILPNPICLFDPDFNCRS